MLSDVVIATARLQLRRFRPDDVEALFAIMSDPKAMQFWSSLPHETSEQTRSWLADTIAATEGGRGDDFAVIHDGRLIGKAGLWNGSELGILFAAETWGTGIAREAADAIIARARGQGHASITADVDPRNERALGFLHALGFSRTGEARRTFKLGDHWTDSVYLELALAAL